MPQRVAAGTQLRLDFRPARPGAEGGDTAGLVEIEQAIHLRQGQGDDRTAGRRRRDVPGHRGAAAVGNHDEVALGRQVQQLAHLLATLGPGHGVGKDAELSRAHGQPVGQALAARVANAELRVGLQQMVVDNAQA